MHFFAIGFFGETVEPVDEEEVEEVGAEWPNGGSITQVEATGAAVRVGLVANGGDLIYKKYCPTIFTFAVYYKHSVKIWKESLQTYWLIKIGC